MEPFYIARHAHGVQIFSKSVYPLFHSIGSTEVKKESRFKIKTFCSLFPSVQITINR
jgi:hypothetical protein